MIDNISRASRTASRKTARRRLAALSGLAIAAAVPAGAAQAAEGIDLSDGRATSTENLATGAKLVLSDENGMFDFAGCPVEAANLTALVGYAAQLAYLVVIDGEAACGSETAKAGRMLIFPPYGGEVAVERFDAARLAQGWSETARNAAPEAFAQLQSIASGQKLGIALGRLAPTRFNVAASGSASSERTWRAELGGQAVRRLRFAPGDDQVAFERQVVASLLDALSRGDAATVAELLDPLPFGQRSLEAGKDAARLALAQTLVRGRDWRGLAGAPPSPAGEALWVAGPAGRQVEIRLRQTRDFAFVQSITDRN